MTAIAMIKKQEVTSLNILMGYIGVLVTLVFELFLIKRAFWFDRGYRSNLILTGLSIFLVGFVFRVLRRRCFYGKSISWHQAFSFEALFQGVNFIFPQIPYPNFERGLLTKENIKPSSLISAWFEIRKSSALLIPIVLGIYGFYQTEYYTVSYLLGISLLALLYTSYMLFNLRFRRSTFIPSLLLGAVAVSLELLCFIILMHQFLDDINLAYSVFLYAAIFIVYEVTPIPMALGVVELLCIGLCFINFMPIEHAFFLLFYRVTRVLPTFLVMLFYLPRYKLSLYDIYHPDIVESLSYEWTVDQSYTKYKKSSYPYQLSIVIPAYNEQNRLKVYLDSIQQYFNITNRSLELVLVDDGSQDATLEIMHAFKEKSSIPVQLITYSKNMGKGYAVREGVLKAKGQWVLFSDADGATPITNVDRLLEGVKPGADIAIAIRQQVNNVVERSLIRDFMGQIFYRLTNLLAVPGIKDTQCGFKLFRHEAAQYLFSKIKEKGWAFDVEALFIAQKRGLKLIEVPVEWKEIEGSKVSLLPASIQMFFALFRIRRRWRGYLESDKEDYLNVSD